MNYGKIKNCDIANGEGVRVSLFVSGCTNRCKGCFQPETWNFGYGRPFTAETEEKLLELISPSYIQGLTLLGGDPFAPSNQRGLLPFVRRVRATYPDKDIWAYTGFTWEELTGEDSHAHTPVTMELLSMIDILVDGRYEEDKKEPGLLFRGSSNQRILKVDQTIKTGKPVLWIEPKREM